MIHIGKKDHRFLLNLFSRLVESGTLTKDESDHILSAVSPTPFDWRRLARYSLWAAVISWVIAISAIFSDDWLLQLISRIFTAPAVAKMIGCVILAGLCYLGGAVRRIKKPNNIYTNEGVMLLGVLANAGAIFWFGDIIGADSNHFSLLILLASMCYCVLGFFLHSQLIWCFGFLSLGGWLGAETGYMSGWGAYYFGLNYPLRFVLFALVSLFCTVILRNNASFQPFYNVTRNLGLLYLFIALWVMSIFGNYGDMTVWSQVKQIELFHWSLLFGCASAVSIYLGCKWDEGPYRGFGLTFLFINLYTRYFEFFWDSLHSAIFFFLLALSLWYLGSKAEKIWVDSELLMHRTQHENGGKSGVGP